MSFDVDEGEILGIIGPNGSGKSTLFNCILGQLQPSGGDVRLDGRAGHRHAARATSTGCGVSRTFQLLQVFPQLTVRENLILAGPGAPGHACCRASSAGATPGSRAAADRMLGFFRLEHLADEEAGG